MAQEMQLRNYVVVAVPTSEKMEKERRGTMARIRITQWNLS